ncbi:hypothetical protein ACHHYP_17115 [Achlya hypogyna]|uniref:LYC1 C-terminal domain-containing protein n=1 Tax=Achlya hypogyna TaxID=1202772 RepID=A0A1V9Y579_ACHHY|nr:hypothetical protein ACHHYP_17115 [Achlya hypogyna]
MSAVELREGTEDQETQVDVLTYNEWGAPNLTYDEYLDREEQFRATPFAASVTDFVLVPTSEPTTLNLHGYLEVFARQVILRPHDATDVVVVDAWSVASVFTPPTHRKKGYAGAMLAAFKHRCHASSAPFVVSNLYSDIGRDFYAQKGWLPTPSDEIEIPVSFELPLAPPGTESYQLHTIATRADLEKITRMDEATVTARLQPGQLAFVLTADAVDFFNVQHTYFARRYRQLTVLPTAYGVYITEAGSDAILGYVIWTHNFEEETLDVLKFDGVDQHIFTAILPALLAEARAWGLQCTNLWPTPEMPLPDDVRALTKPRDDSLAMLLVQDKAGRDVPFKWIANEKYLYA